MTAPGAGYRDEIDGLRAVAVVAVVLFHLGFRWIPGGFVGVDVFFVISGFLITGILLGELQTGTFSFRGFWARRILRIFPALLVTVVATLAAAWFVSPRSDHPAIGQQAVAALLSVANLWFWRNSCEYWGQAAEISPLLHTWSLSVEEQFYLCFPLLLWAIAARAGRFLPLLLAAAGVASFGYFLAGIRAHGFEAMFYLLPSRAWELGLGCCLATVPQWQGRGVPLLPAAVRSGLAVAGLALIAWPRAGCLRAARGRSWRRCSVPAACSPGAARDRAARCWRGRPLWPSARPLIQSTSGTGRSS
jgi:peptidoglycan/LPS O-acetylase OafA/YrhL